MPAACNMGQKMMKFFLEATIRATMVDVYTIFVFLNNEGQNIVFVMKLVHHGQSQ